MCQQVCARNLHVHHTSEWFVWKLAGCFCLTLTFHILCVFVQLLERLKFYAGFEINDQSGSSLTDHEMTDIHYNKYTLIIISSYSTSTHSTSHLLPILPPSFSSLPSPSFLPPSSSSHSHNHSLFLSRITSLQRAAFKLFPDLRSFALSNVASVDTQSALLSHFGGLKSVVFPKRCASGGYYQYRDCWSNYTGQK